MFTSRIDTRPISPNICYRASPRFLQVPDLYGSRNTFANRFTLWFRSDIASILFMSIATVETVRIVMKSVQRSQRKLF